MAFWDDLPDPRDPDAPKGAHTQVILDRRSWKHILSEHVLPGREAWADIFSGEVLRRLVRQERPETFADEVIGKALGALAWQICAALERPLVLLYEVRRLGGSGAPLGMWTLVLPSGATAYVRETEAGNRLVTCYFPVYTSVIKNKGFRWRRVVSHLVWRYGVVDTHQNAVVLPTDGTVKLIPRRGPVREFHSAIRFVTPTTWGFCPELAGCPWRGRLAPWPAAEEPSPGPRHRLKPRLRRSPDEEDFTV